MKNLAVAFAALALAACAGAPTPAAGPAVTPPAPVMSSQAPPSPNRLTVATSAPRPIVAPRIRVGLLSDQPSVTFPRTTDGYYLAGD
ncbi:MAG: hypothetical protein ABI837_17910, partial [Acidobacteriota bacterium]